MGILGVRLVASEIVSRMAFGRVTIWIRGETSARLRRGRRIERIVRMAWIRSVWVIPTIIICVVVSRCVRVAKYCVLPLRME